MTECDCLYEAILHKYSLNIESGSLPVNVSSDMTMFLSTLNIFKSNSDHSLVVSFFEEFMSVLKKVPPQSLSLVWGQDEARRKILGFPNMDAILKVAHNRSNVADIQEASLLGSNSDHDPLQLVYRLVEACKDSILHVFGADERLALFHALLAIGIKSARAHILLEGAWQLICFAEATYTIGPQVIPVKSLDPALPTIDVGLLGDLRAYLAANHAPEAGVTGAAGEEVPTLIQDSATLSTTNSDMASSSVSVGKRTKLCVSFGKADHGKLGHGDTVVRLSATVPCLLSCCLYYYALFGFVCRFIARFPR